MRIGVLGAGSMGSLFAGSLAGSGGDTVLLARESAHVDAIRDGGLRLRRHDGSATTVSVPVSTDPEDVPPCDAVLVCVKSYDTDAALREWGDAVREADVCTFQNGLGNAETLGEHLDPARVLAGTTSHGAVREGPGVVRHAGVGETRVGRYFAGNDAAVRDLADALTGAGVETTVVADPRAAVWRKVLVNVGINAATALARVENGALVESESGRRLLRRAVVEATRVARAEGVEVGADAVTETLTVAERTASNRSSMRQDVEAGRRTEVEALHGAVVDRADAHDLPAPVNRTLADLVRLAQSSAGRGQP